MKTQPISTVQTVPAPLTSLDDAQLAAVTGGSASDVIAKITQQGVPLLQSAAPLIDGAVSLFKSLKK